MLIGLCVVGYVVAGILTAAYFNSFDDGDEVEVGPTLAVISFWPFVLPLMATLGLSSWMRECRRVAQTKRDLAEAAAEKALQEFRQ